MYLIFLSKQNFFVFVVVSYTPKLTEKLRALTRGAETDNTEHGASNIRDLFRLRTQVPERGK